MKKINLIRRPRTREEVTLLHFVNQPCTVCLNLHHILLYVTILALLLTQLNADVGSDLTAAKSHFQLGQKFQYNHEQRDVLQAVAHYTKARELVHNVQQYDFNYPGMLNDLGTLLASIGEWKVAVEVYEEALSMDAHLLSASLNLAGLLAKLGQYEAAENIYNRATRRTLEVKVAADGSGSDVDAENYGAVVARFNYGIFAFERSDWEKAELLWKECLQLDPNFYLVWSNLAALECAVGSEDLEVSQGYYDQAIAITRNLSSSDNLLLERSALHSLLLQKFGGVFPMLYMNSTAILAARRRFIAGQRDLLHTEHSANSVTDLLHAVGCTSIGYYAIYQGFHDIYLRQLQAAVYWQLSSHVLSYVSPHIHQLDTIDIVSSSTTGNSLERRQSWAPRLRIGFLSAFFYHHSVGLLLQGVIKRLNRDLFEVFVLTVNQDRKDAITAALESSSNTSLFHLQGDIRELFERVASLRLDVLVFGELGMNPATYFLAFGRLAERSLVFWGHAVTSGILPLPLMNSSDFDEAGPDYFISSVLFEGAGTTEQSPRNRWLRQRLSQLQYTERLLLQDGMTTYFERPPKPLSADELRAMYLHRHATTDPPEDIGRRPKEILLSLHPLSITRFPEWYLDLPSKEEFLRFLDPALIDSFPRDFRLYAVPQTLYKLHIDFDEILVEILIRDPSAVIALPRGNSPNLVNTLRKRIKLALTAALQQSSLVSTVDLETALHRLVFLPNMESREFLTFCAVADVHLDPFPVGGGRTSFEAFSVGAPIVFLPQRTSILQLTYAMYATMGLLPRPDFDAGVKYWDDFDYDLTEDSRDDNDDAFAYSSCCQAANVTDFVEKALRVAHNKAYQFGLKSEILRRSDERLLEDASVVEEWEKMLLYVAASPRPQKRPTRLRDQPPSVLARLVDRSINDTSIDSLVDGISARCPLWLREELDEAHFPYLEPPLQLSRIVEVENCLFQLLRPKTNFVMSRNRCFHFYSAAEENLTQISSQHPLDPYQGLSITSDAPLHLIFKTEERSKSIPGRFDEKEIVVDVKAAGDWRGTCIAAARSVGVFDKLKLLYVCALTARAVIRQRKAIVNWVTIDHNNTKTNVDLRERDDPGLLLQLLASGYFSDALLNSNRLELGLNAKVLGELSSQLVPWAFPSGVGSDEEIQERELSTNLWLTWSQLENNSAIEGLDLLNGWNCLSTGDVSKRPTATTVPQYTDPYHNDHSYRIRLEGNDNNMQKIQVVLGMTTCRRLQHFLATIGAIEAAFAFQLPNDLIPNVVIVDDASTMEDRKTMATKYPQFEFLFKPATLRGHASSMNLLTERALEIIRNQPNYYFLYLEDDWRLLDQPILHYNLAPVVDILTPTLEVLHAFASLLLAAARILREDEPDAGSRGIKIDQVLFNEQGTRGCAEGNERCNVDVIGSGGWPRNRRLEVNTTLKLRVPYSLHEFGLVPIPGAYGDRNHEFTYWPGLSLNPGLWDLRRIASKTRSCLRSDENASVKKIFHEVDVLFEQRFSVLCHAAGLHMAFFPSILFHHMGDDVSAYALNDFKRPWDS